MATVNYDVNYDDSRFHAVNDAKNDALQANEETYQGMIDESDRFYQDQIRENEKWEDKQIDLQNQQTDLAIDQIEQQKSDARKDYLKEQSGAYVDWQKQSNEYGVNAEKTAASGMANTGYSETSQVSMYNTYQNRIATARESYNRVITDFNNKINEAILQNNVAIAEIAYESQKQRLELTLQGFQYKNQLLLDKAEKKLAIDSEYYSRYQDVLKQINTENALAEEVRQYNKNLELEKEKFKLQQDMFQFEQDKYADSKSSGGSGGSIDEDGNGGKINDDSGLPDATKNSIIKMGYGPISAENLASKVASGEVKETTKNGVTTFSKTGKNTKKTNSAGKSTVAPSTSKTKNNAKYYSSFNGALWKLNK